MFPDSAATIGGCVPRVRSAAGPRRPRRLRVDQRLARRRDLPGRLRGPRLARRPSWSSPARRPARSRPTSPVGVPVFGVRFRLGVAGAALGLPAGEFPDATVPVADLWGPGVDERVAAGGIAALRAGRARAAGRRAGRPARPRGGAGDGAPGRARGRARRCGRERAPAAAPLRRRGRLRAEDARAGPALPALPGARRARATTSRGWRWRRATPTRRTSRARRGGWRAARRWSSSPPGAGAAGERL